jgi:hypothetical protein
MVSGKLPDGMGVPVITPVLFRDKPCGRLPEARDQVYGGVPPEASMDVL